MHVVIDKLVWREWNIAHMWEKHLVTPEEIVESLEEQHVMVTPAKHGRVMVLGRAGKRLLSTIFSEQESANVYLVVTARDMSKKERALYRSQKGINDK